MWEAPAPAAVAPVLMAAPTPAAVFDASALAASRKAATLRLTAVGVGEAAPGVKAAASVADRIAAPTEAAADALDAFN